MVSSKSTNMRQKLNSSVPTVLTATLTFWWENKSI